MFFLIYGPKLSGKSEFAKQLGEILNIDVLAFSAVQTENTLDEGEDWYDVFNDVLLQNTVFYADSMIAEGPFESAEERERVFAHSNNGHNKRYLIRVDAPIELCAQRTKPNIPIADMILNAQSVQELSEDEKWDKVFTYNNIGTKEDMIAYIKSTLLPQIQRDCD